MRCSACGQQYGIVHCCPGSIAAPEAPLAPPPALRFAPLHYFREAMAIARWDEAAIQRAARDKNALLYGLLFWSIAYLLSRFEAITTILSARMEFPWAGYVLGLFLLLPFAALLTVAQYGLCHLLARWWFHATGSFLGVLRPYVAGDHCTVAGHHSTRRNLRGGHMEHCHTDVGL